MDDINGMLEFDKIRELLKEGASTERARERIDALVPILDQERAEAAIEETTEARKVLDSLGTPPSGSTQEVREIAQEAELGSLLGAGQLDQIRQFAVLCMRLSRYLGKCRDIAPGIAGYGAGIQDLSPLQEEIERCIRGGRVDDYASRTLHTVRRHMEQLQDQIRLKLENMLRSSRSIFSESFVSNRNGHYTVPVKKEHKNKVPGTVIDASSTGATVFIEPSAISRLREELETLRIEEENEEKMILYTLSAMVADSAEAIRINLEYMEELDFIFAKGKLSVSMKASRPKLNTERRIRLVNGRHPLLPIQNVMPSAVMLSSISSAGYAYSVSASALSLFVLITSMLYAISTATDDGELLCPEATELPANCKANVLGWNLSIWNLSFLPEKSAFPRCSSTPFTSSAERMSDANSTSTS